MTERMRTDANELARRQIAAVLERLLTQAGVGGVFPTPLGPVATAAGVKELMDIGELPEELAAAKPSAWRRILGALFYRTDTAFVDLSLPSRRARFIEAHETVHRAIPWHRASFHVDDERRLSPATEELLDAEANWGAAYLLFQGPRFHARALDYETSLKTPIALASVVEASFHATIRYYVEHHPREMAVIIAGRYPRSDGTAPVWTAVESPSFAKRFGSLGALFSDTGLCITGGTQPFAQLAKASIVSPEVSADTIVLNDLAGTAVQFTAEAFFNQRCVFVMVSRRFLLRLGRRIRVQIAS